MEVCALKKKTGGIFFNVKWNEANLRTAIEENLTNR
jgi:hypothetical protein